MKSVYIVVKEDNFCDCGNPHCIDIVGVYSDKTKAEMVEQEHSHAWTEEKILQE